MGRMTAWGVIFLILAGLLSFSTSLSGDLVWDDHHLVGNGGLFRSPLFFFEVFNHWLDPNSPVPYYRPVQNLSYFFDYLLWRGNLFGYRFTNLLLHGASAAFLFLVLGNLFSLILEPRKDPLAPRICAFLIALVWVCHPIHNAVTAYISGRADSLASLFSLFGWWLALKARKWKSPYRYVGFTGALFAALLALCSML